MSWVNYAELAVAIVSAPFIAFGIINGIVGGLFGDAGADYTKRKAKR